MDQNREGKDTKAIQIRSPINHRIPQSKSLTYCCLSIWFLFYLLLNLYGLVCVQQSKTVNVMLVSDGKFQHRSRGRARHGMVGMVCISLHDKQHMVIVMYISMLTKI